MIEHINFSAIAEDISTVISAGVGRSHQIENWIPNVTPHHILFTINGADDDPYIDAMVNLRETIEGYDTLLLELVMMFESTGVFDAFKALAKRLADIYKHDSYATIRKSYTERELTDLDVAMLFVVIANS